MLECWHEVEIRIDYLVQYNKENKGERMNV